MQAGDRSLLFYWGGGAAKVPNHGDYAGPRGMLAFWIGGACFHYIELPPVPYPPLPMSSISPAQGCQPQGISTAKEIELILASVLSTMKR